MVNVKDKDNFNVSKNDILNYLANSKYKSRYNVYETFLRQEDIRWMRGKKRDFQQSLVDIDLNYFAYIKFYLKEGKEYALVVGKSGSKKVNKTSGCDLSFSTNIEHGQARKWLSQNSKLWCQTEIIIVWTNAIEKIDSEKEAYMIESDLQKKFDLFGS